MSSSPGAGPYGDGDDHGPYEPRRNPYDPFPRYAPGAGARQAPPDLDGVSIAGMVCALTCCAGPIGVGLSIAGMVRTKRGKRRGRWAAVTGLVVGTIATLGLVAGGIGVVWYATNVVYFDDTRAGACIDVDGDVDLDVWKATCTESHDAEVIHSAAMSKADVATYRATDAVDFCRQQPVIREYEPLFSDPDYAIYVIVESWDEEDPDPGDRYLCVVERSDGEPLDHRILDDPPQATSEDGEAGATYVEDTSIGDCFDAPDTPTEPVEVVACTVPHDGEIIVHLVVKGSSFPGDEEIEREASNRCMTAFEAYVGASYEDSPHDFGYWYPSKTSWARGDRAITCAAYATVPDEKLTGPVKDSGKAVVSG